MARTLSPSERGDAAPAAAPRAAPKSRIGRAFGGVRRFLADFLDDEPFSLAAATSYYTLLSLAPLLLIVVGLASFVFEREAVEGRIVEEMRYLIGEAGAEAMQTVILNSTRSESGLSLGVGLLVLLLGASTVFQQLSSALNRIWEVKPDKKAGGWRAFVRKRILSFAMVLAIGFLLLVSLVVSAGLSAAGGFFDSGGDPTLLWQAVNMLVSFLVITVLFALMFKFLPDAEIRWRHVWAGAALTSILFTFGKYAIGLYLGRASVGTSFGAAGSIVVFTVWIYYASLLVFLGAKLTRLHADRAGDPAPPQEFARPDPS